MTKAMISLCMLAALAAGGCEKKSEAKQHGSAEPAASAPATPPAAPSAPADSASAREKPPIELKLGSVGNEMRFDTTKLEVKAGERVHLVLHSHSTLKVMPHNWVLVKPGTEAAVALAGVERGEAQSYVAPGPDVLAYTPLAGPGADAEVTFTAPPAGTYPYICTVPGHYLSMKGQLVVQP